jgi:hypothetical protein
VSPAAGADEDATDAFDLRGGMVAVTCSVKRLVGISSRRPD